VIAYLVALAHGNPFAFALIVGTVVLGCIAAMQSESRAGN
jgi:hypothetical protein